MLREDSSRRSWNPRKTTANTQLVYGTPPRVIPTCGCLVSYSVKHFPTYPNSADSPFVSVLSSLTTCCIWWIDDLLINICPSQTSVPSHAFPQTTPAQAPNLYPLSTPSICTVIFTLYAYYPQSTLHHSLWLNQCVLTTLPFWSASWSEKSQQTSRLQSLHWLFTTLLELKCPL